MAAAKTAKSLAPMTVLVCRTNSFMVSIAYVIYQQQPRPGHNHQLGTMGRAYLLPDRKPMKVVQCWCYVVKLTGTGLNNHMQPKS